MDLELSEAQERIRDRARGVAESELAPRAAHADAASEFPEAQMRRLAEAGLLAMLVSPEHGGSGAGSVGYSLALTEVARACAATSVTMAVTNMVADAISAFGTEAQRKRYIPELASGALVAGAFALSEPGAGSDAASLMATAVRRGDHYVLSGSKCWITSGDRAGVVLVMAKTDPALRAGGISAFLVEPSMRGFFAGRHEDKMGMRGSSTVTLTLDDVEVPEHNRLGPEGSGFKIAMRALDGGRIGVGSQAVGIGLAALELAVTHAAARDNLARDQSVQWRLADSATELDAARLLTLRAASLKDAGKPFSREASMAKVFSSEAANRATARALDVLGEEGLTASSAAERLFRDVRVTTIYEGTSEIQRLVIARSLLTGPA